MKIIIARFNQGNIEVHSETEADADMLIDWLAKYGFTVTRDRNRSKVLFIHRPTPFVTGDQLPKGPQRTLEVPEY